MIKTIYKSLLTLFSILTILSSFFILAEYTTHTNFIMNTFNINYVEFFFISIVGFILSFIFLFGKNVVKKYKYAIFLFPVFLIFISLIIFMKRFDLFLYLESEDSIIETLQIMFLFFSGILSFILSRLFKNKKILSMLLLVVSIGLFLVFGEEVSWGQRILDIATPAKYAELNTQGELTIHNYGPLFEYVYKGYALIGLVGMFGWLFKKIILKTKNIFLKQISILFPDWQYIPYFFLVFAYNFEVHILDPRGGAFTGDALWEEPMELLLFIGVTIFFVELLTKELYKRKIIKIKYLKKR